MKVVVFLYASLYFVITLISGITEYTINFNTHKTLEHAYHRALRSSIEGDLLASGLIENRFKQEFRKMSPKDLDYKVTVMGYNRSPKALRVEVLAKRNGKEFRYDETMIEEVYLD